VKFTATGPGLSKLRERLEAIADLEVRVGVLGDGGYHDAEMTNAELLAIHEFGAPRANIPERAPLRGAFDAYEKRWQNLAARLLKAVLSEKIDPQQALGVLGERAVADIRAHVRAGLEPPLKEATVRRKGSSTPLIDTGRLLQAFAYEIGEKA
jgi:hypothetical protein